MLSEDELKNVPVLVFANKQVRQPRLPSRRSLGMLTPISAFTLSHPQDIAGALSPAEISDKLGLAGGEKGREWSVRGSCATKGDGLEEGLDWLVNVIQK